MHLHNWQSQRLQICCKGWMCKSQPTDDKLSLIWAWSGHVTHYKILGSNHITGTAEPKVVKFCTRVGSINSMQQDDISPNKRAWLWWRDCFKILPLVVMQRDARVCQRRWATCNQTNELHWPVWSRHCSDLITPLVMEYFRTFCLQEYFVENLTESLLLKK